MSMHFRDISLHGATPAEITADDVLALRRAVWQDGIADAVEAEALLSLNASITVPGKEWVEFFVEAVSVWLVDQQVPRGYVDEAQADWLIVRLPHAGATEIELLAKILEKARSAPDHLRRFALTQIEHAVLDGDCRVTAAEAQLLRRVLFASGGDRPAGVSQAEAEMLFRIKNACLAADNDPEWQRLFVQGVGNFLQGAVAATPLPRERELELERFMSAPEPGLASFLGRIGRAGTGGFSQALHDVFGHAPQHDWSGDALRAASINPGEQSWLDGNIQADGTVDAYEQALFDFLAQG